MKGFSRFALVVCLAGFYGAAEAATLKITTDGTVSGAVSAIGPNGGPVCNPNPGGGGGGSCTFTYAAGTPLRLSANSPNTPGIFHGGTGDAVACATSTCAFVINTDSEITATFDAGDFRSIQIVLAGVGNVGTNNTQCQNYELGSSVCTSYYGVGSVVTLEGRSVPGNIFTGFSGGTAGASSCASSPCVFTLNNNSSIDAGFAALASVAVTPATASATVGGSSPNFTATGTFTNTSATRSVAGLNASWRPLRPMSAHRFGLASGVVNNKVYVVGGVPEICEGSPCPFGPLDTVEVYDPVASGFGGIDSWTTRAPMLTAREGLAAAVVNGKVYALGGHTSGGGPVATIEAYDPAANAWTLKADMSASRSGLAAAVINNVIYAVGGDAAVGGQPAILLDTLEAYDPASNTWTTKTPMLHPRSGFAAAAVNGKLYAIGGDASGTVEEYDPSTFMWTMKAPMPNGGGEAAGGAIDGLIYVITGSSANVNVYNPATNAWATLGTMPSARRQFALGVLDGRFFTSGGLAGSGQGAPVATHEAFRPPEATWWSSNTAVATINQSTRTATGLSAGTTTISARTVGIDSASSATLTVGTGGGGGGGTQVILSLPGGGTPPNPVQAQVGNANWGCGTFSSQTTTGTWSVTVNYGDGTIQSLPFILSPQPGDPCMFPGSGTPTGSFSFNHAYASPGSPLVRVTVARSVGGTVVASQTGEFTVVVSAGGGGGDDGCSPVTTNFVAGSVPFSTVHLALFDRPTGQLVFEGDAPLGMTEIGSAPAGSYRVEFSVPAGYSITPAQIEFDVICGQAVLLAAQIGVPDTTPPVVTTSGNVTVPATMPGGAVATFSSSALDAVDGATVVSCLPASGSIFPVGATTVTCSSTDAHNNTGSATLTVTVLSAQQVLASLIVEVGTLTFQQASNLLQNVLKSLDKGNAGAACSQLGAFINQVAAQSGKSLTAAEATTLIQSANAARGALGCQ